jgi:integrase/recombinase XerD
MALRAWLAVRDGGKDPALFFNAAGQAMTRAGFEYILAKHAATAARKQPSLGTKRVTPHVLRRSCAMHMLRATRDIRRVSLWLGHAGLQSTEIYLRADPTEKLEALTVVTPPALRRGQFRPQDALIALLQESR